MPSLVPGFLIEFIIIALVLVVNAVFVVSEVAILTSSKAKLHKLASGGSKGARRAIKLTQEPERFLSTAQVGISFMNILLGLYGGSSMSEYIADVLKDIPYLNQFATPAYSALIGSVVSIVSITYITVLSEIIPKRIAMLNPEVIASWTAHIMTFFACLCYPLVASLTLSTRFCLKLFGIKATKHAVSMEEIKFLINQAEHSGALEKVERDMIKRLANISSMQVGAIMTPRNKIIAIDINHHNKINIEKLRKYQFNFFPVIDGDLNSLIGMLSVKSVINVNMSNSALVEKARETAVLYVPEMARVTKLMELFRSKQAKAAVVLDEYGEIEGIVTLNDILKTFISDLSVLMEGKRPACIRRGENEYLVNGNVPIEEIMELLQLQSLPGSDEEEYRILASFILRQLNTLPRVGDVLNVGEWSFKVIKMDNLRVDRVLIKKSPQDNGPSPSDANYDE